MSSLPSLDVSGPPLSPKDISVVLLGFPPNPPSDHPN